MIILVWHTPKEVIEPTHREMMEKNARKGISTTKGNYLNEIYPQNLIDEIDALGYGESYDDEGNRRGIYFSFFTEAEMREAVKRSRLLKGKLTFYRQSATNPEEILAA